MNNNIMKKTLTSLTIFLLVLAMILGGFSIRDSEKGSVTNNEEVEIIYDSGKVDENGNRFIEDDSEIINTINISTGKPETQEPVEDDSIKDENGSILVPFDIAYPDAFESGEFKYDEKTLLIKIKNGKNPDKVLKSTGVLKTEEMFSISSGTWYKGFVAENDDLTRVIDSVRSINDVVEAEYNFVWETSDVYDELELNNNPKISDQWYLNYIKAPETWQYQIDNELPVAGQGTVVAVIDTGIDYEHEDLFNNMWINHAEIPDNGIDDDNNGYVDDYYGVDIVNGSGSGKDDNGHGTHVAGIIAAANNDKGIVGVAFNSKVMAVKAGSASGYFLQSDIADAIMYAYNNGADVINMSFGGSASSIAVQDALEFAYTNCILVASAGNNGIVNEKVPGYIGNVIPSYPAALSYVLGVMAVDQSGIETYFTNYDGIAASKVEYEIYAPGFELISSIPNNRYARWSGTSMASPVVAAIAANIRAVYNDTSMYPTKFIYGQLSSTGETKAICFDPETHAFQHNTPSIVNAYNSITKEPVPEVHVRDYTIFDTTDISDKNNGDGIVDSGEIIALGFEIWNRWGVAKDTIVSISAYSSGDMPNPYVRFATSFDGEYGTIASVNYGMVGTYSTQDAGKILDKDYWIGWENPFYIKVDENCPNDMIVTITVDIQTKNGLNENDDTIYFTEPKDFSIVIRNGYILPSIIDEDMTWTADNYYILSDSVYIKEGTVVNVEPGTNIQFWSSDKEDSYADTAIVKLRVDGELNFNGSRENYIKIFPSEVFAQYVVQMYGNINLNFCEITNACLHDGSSTVERGKTVRSINNCKFVQYSKGYLYQKILSNNGAYNREVASFISAEKTITKSLFYKIRGVVNGIFDECAFIDSAIEYWNNETMWNVHDTLVKVIKNNRYTNCLFYGNNDFYDDVDGLKSNYEIPHSRIYEIDSNNIIKDKLTGTTYCVMKVHYPYINNEDDFIPTFDEIDSMLSSFGAHIVDLNSDREKEFVKQIYNSSDIIQYNYIIVDENGRVTDINSNEIELVGNTLEKGKYLSLYYGDTVSYGQKLWGQSYDVSYWHDSFILVEIPGDIYIENIGLSTGAIYIEKDGLYTIKSTPYPTNGKQLIYESDDIEIATVDENGVITGKEVGSCDIRVFSDDKGVYSILHVDVVEPILPTGIELHVDKNIIDLTETCQLSYELIPQNTTKTDVHFENSDETVAIVDEGGIVTPIKPGTTTITVRNAYDPNIYSEVEIIVNAKISEISFKNPVYLTSIDKNDGHDFYPTILPSNSTELINWKSSNPEIAYVDESGNLVKLKNGTVQLKAIADESGLSDTVFIAVSEYEPSKIKKIQTDGYRNFVLFENGQLWWWDSSIKYPKQLKCSTRIKDFVISGYGDFYILDMEGRVYKSNLSFYEINNNEPEFSEYLSNVVKLSSVYETNEDRVIVALQNDGSVWCWNGYNDNGLYGNGTNLSSNKPVQMAITNAVDIKQKLNMVTVLTENGDLFISGGNNSYNIPTLMLNNINKIQDDINGFSDNYIYVYNSQNEIWRIDSDGNAQYCDHTYGDYQYYVDNVYFYINEGNLYVKGNTENAWLGLGESVTTTNNEFVLVDEIQNAKSVYSDGKSTYVQTQNMDLYGFGKNNNCQINAFTTNDIYLPEKMILGLCDNYDTLDIKSTNINEENNELSGKTIIVDFNDSIFSTYYFDGITLTDDEGTLFSITKNISLNQLIVTSYFDLEDGKSYSLKIPYNAVKTITSKSLSNDIYLDFVYRRLIDISDKDENENTININNIRSNKQAVPTYTNEEVKRFYWNEELIKEKTSFYLKTGDNYCFNHNAIINRFTELNPQQYWFRPQGAESSNYQEVSLTNNYWGTNNEDLIYKQIVDFKDYQTLTYVNADPWLTEAPSSVWPFVVEAGVMNSNGEVVSTVGNEGVTFFVEFNRPMDTEVDLDFRFGSTYPYADYKVDGVWVSETRWEGIAALSTTIESGLQYMSINNAYSGDEDHLKFYKDWGRFTFTIDLSAALSMNMQGEATDTGISLTWNQDDFDTLIGYNVYRSTSENGEYIKLNSTLIPVGEEEFFDGNVEPGQEYWYSFTVMQSDLTESTPSGRIMVRSKDTMAPNIYHSPVVTAYTGSNLVISATITDNVAVQSAKLYYRITGTNNWKSVEMQKNNDKYYGHIPTVDVTLAGIEYYIDAFDGISHTYKGSAEEPFSITIKEAIGNDQLGDVDGDGKITNKDALMILQQINGLLFLDNDQFIRADINKDGELSAFEALRILKYVSGKVNTIAF